MFKQNYNVIGIMSGTSLDGVDLAHIKFYKKENWTFEILETKTVSYTQNWLNTLRKAVNFSNLELIQLNEDYTLLLSQIIIDFILEYNIKNIDAVCNHGHTIIHKPDLGYTLQIGNLPILAQMINQIVVCDFRVQDVLLGGQGAPLVPIGDKMLFPEYDYCLNLGGFSNISFDENGKRIAYDISPVNSVLNFYANTFNLSYDDKGIIAKSGSINSELFHKLNEIEFYKLPYPKSLGIEFVNEIIFPIIEKSKLDCNDIMNTFVEHIAFQISKNIKNKQTLLFITGGGVYNDFLMDRIKFYLPKNKIVIPDGIIIEFKEALIFAFLGVLKLRNEINVFGSVTGALKDHCSGIIFTPSQK